MSISTSGVTVDEDRQHGRQQQAGGVARDTQANPPRGGVPEAVESIERAADGLEGSLDFRPQSLARGGERDAAIGAVDQAHAKSRFQPLQGMAQGGRGHAEFDACQPEVAMLGDREEINQISEVGATRGHPANLSIATTTSASFISRRRPARVRTVDPAAVSQRGLSANDARVHQIRVRSAGGR